MVFWNKCYAVITSVYDVKILSHDSIYNFSISMREVIITSILQRFDQKNQFFSRGASIIRL